MTDADREYADKMGAAASTPLGHGVLADELEERDWHHDQGTLDTLRKSAWGELPEGHTVHITRHPRTGKVVAWGDAIPSLVKTFDDLHALRKRRWENPLWKVSHGPGGLIVMAHAIDRDGAPRYHVYRANAEGALRDQDPAISASEMHPDIDHAFKRTHERAWGEAPVKLSRTAGTNQAAAVQGQSTANMKAVLGAVRQLLSQAGERGSPLPVVTHSDGGGFRPDVMVHLDGAVHPKVLDYIAAWHGLLNNHSATVAFNAHSAGADRLHVIHTQAQPRDVAQALRDAGVPKFSVHSGTAYVFDKGGAYDLSPVARTLNASSYHAVNGTGRVIGAGEGADAASSRAAYRAAIDSAETAAGGTAAQPGAEKRDPAVVKLAREGWHTDRAWPAATPDAKLSRPKAKDVKPAIKMWEDALAADPNAGGVFADFLEERDWQHGDGAAQGTNPTLEFLRAGHPVKLGIHPDSGKVLAWGTGVPFSPRPIRSVPDVEGPHGSYTLAANPHGTNWGFYHSSHDVTTIPNFGYTSRVGALKAAKRLAFTYPIRHVYRGPHGMAAVLSGMYPRRHQYAVLHPDGRPGIVYGTHEGTEPEAHRHAAFLAGLPVEGELSPHMRRIQQERV